MTEKKVNAFNRIWKIFLVFCMILCSIPVVSVKADGGSATVFEGPSGLVSVAAVEEVEESGGTKTYKNLASSVSLEKGDQFCLKISFNANKLDRNMSVIKDITATLDYNSGDNFIRGDNVLVDPSDGTVSRYTMTWDALTGEKQIGSVVYDVETGGKITLTVNQESADNNPKGIYVIVPFTVKKAVDKEFTFSLSDIRVNGKQDLDDVTYTYSNAISTKLQNRLYGKRKVELSAYSARMKDQGNLSVRECEQIYVPLYVKQNTGFNRLRIEMEYNDAMLELQKIVLSDQMKKLGQYISSDLDEGMIEIVLNSDTDIADEKPLVYFVFEARDLVVIPDEGTQVSFAVRGVSNESETTMTNVNSGGLLTRLIIIRPKRELGDIDDDGYVNLVDAAMILQYYNGKRHFDARQLEFADYDQNGRISLVDVLLIMKYYNENDYTT